MPMINVEWLPNFFKRDDVLELCHHLDGDLRSAIKLARPSVCHEYKIEIRGNPQSNISIGTPDFEVRIEYHAEWEFTQDEIESISNSMAKAIESRMGKYPYQNAISKLRIYKKVGYKGVNLKFD